MNFDALTHDQMMEALTDFQNGGPGKFHQPVTIETTPTLVKTFSEQQEMAMSMILAWLEEEDQEFRLGGYAGTGKTTLINELLRRLKNMSVAICAFTGKAVAVLRRKGVDQAQTLHSLLYRYEYDWRKRKQVQVPVERLFRNLVIVDESSMVSTELYNILKSHTKVKLLFVGDPAQLEPVGDNPNLMQHVNYTLTDVHRQAKKSPILRLATALREGRVYTPPEGDWNCGEDGHLIVTRDPNVLDGQTDTIICGKNATRHMVNKRRREKLGINTEAILNEGESVLCLRNARDFGVFNGMTFTVKSLRGRRSGFDCDLVNDLGEDFPEVPVSGRQFGKEPLPDEMRKSMTTIPFDYGYCLTAHKSQGSEWDTVTVVDEPLYRMDHARWRYTVTTRAAKKLIYLL